MTERELTMEEKKMINRQKLLLILRGVAVFAVLLVLLFGLNWAGYHRYANVAVREGEPEDALRQVRLVETDTLYIRLDAPEKDPDDTDDDVTPDLADYYTVDEVLGEVKPASLSEWNKNYVVEHIKDRDDLIYLVIDGKRVLYYSEDISPDVLEILKDQVG